MYCRLREKCFIADRIPALVFRGVYETAILKLGLRTVNKEQLHGREVISNPEKCNGLFVRSIRRPNEVVKINVRRLRKLLLSLANTLCEGYFCLPGIACNCCHKIL